MCVKQSKNQYLYTIIYHTIIISEQYNNLNHKKTTAGNKSFFYWIYVIFYADSESVKVNYTVTLLTLASKEKSWRSTQIFA